MAHAPAPPRPWRLGQRVRTTAGVVATDVFGSGPPVVLTHGTPVWSYLWRDVAAALAARHTVYVWDLPGYGDSTTADAQPPTIAGHATALAELIAHWDLPDAVLAGHDIGGATVLRAHLLEHAPARGLVLIDAAVLAPWMTPAAEHMRQYQDAYRTMPATSFATLIGAHLDNASHTGLDPDARAQYLDRYAGPEGRQRWLEQIEHFTEDQTRETAARLGEIAVPAKIVWGAHDTWLPAETARRLAERIPNSSYTILDDAGHFTPEDAAVPLTRVLLDFLA